MTLTSHEPAEGARRVTPASVPAQVWSPHWAATPAVPATDLPPGSLPARVVALCAHPDDETIGAGRLLAWWAARGVEVLAMCATAGDACGAEAGLDLDRPSLARAREAEWRLAMADLGVHAGLCAGLPDGGLDTAATRAELLALVDGAVRPGDLVVAPWRHDPHPDHSALGFVAAGVAEVRGATLLEYPVWALAWSSPSQVVRTGWRPVLVSFPLRERPALETTRDRALGRFVSQLQPLAPDVGPVVPRDMLAHHDAQVLMTKAGA